MKTCPVCHAGAFDDAQVCFVCLHRFDELAEGGFSGGSPLAAAPEGKPDAAAADEAQGTGCENEKIVEAVSASAIAPHASEREETRFERKSDDAAAKLVSGVLLLQIEVPGFLPSGGGCAVSARFAPDDGVPVQSSVKSLSVPPALLETPQGCGFLRPGFEPIGSASELALDAVFAHAARK